MECVAWNQLSQSIWPIVINSIISIRASGKTWGSKEAKVIPKVKSDVIQPLGPKGLGLPESVHSAGT